jgi:hypothetical protein
MQDRKNPEISIAGKMWEIPILSPMQNRRIIPRLGAMRKLDAMAMTEQDIDNCYQIIFWALTRKYPETKEADFMSWEIPMTEVMEALPIVAQQTGVVKITTDGAPVIEEETSILTGEEQRATETPSIGTVSSPASPSAVDGNGTT